MLHKTQGIILKTTLYAETSVVVQILTRKFGIQTYLINGVKKPKAKIHINTLQALHLVEMIVYHKENGNLQRISELRPFPIFTTIPYDIVKSTIVMFLNEVLYKSIRQQDADENLFDFIHHSLCWFDAVKEPSVNFHLAFLLKLTKFFGFAPQTVCLPQHCFFDLLEGDYVVAQPIHPFISLEESEYFAKLFSTPFEHIDEIKISNGNRRAILNNILIYYKLHVNDLVEIKSHTVLEAVLS
ncbi:MAG: DNA repair protein RecO [Sphingobacteriaceae bacterium]|nr:DNA repair protein RecO [Sphingobacteriaceae bacterium]